jgi:hypothetical protein
VEKFGRGVLSVKSIPYTEVARSTENLWFLMHHSMDPNREVFAVNCYLDESATDGSTPQAVVAGVLFSRDGFLNFDREWRETVNARVTSLKCLYPPHPEQRSPKPSSALHIAEFGPTGELSRVPAVEASSIFAAAARIINKHKLFSIAATIGHEEYRKFLDPEIKGKMGVYGLCYILSVYENHELAVQNNYRENIGFILDAGNPHAPQVFEAHSAILNWQKSEPLNAGSITFDDDNNVTALQAADVVAWSVRRRLVGETFSHGRKPLRRIFNSTHVEQSWDVDMLRAIDSRLMRIADKTNQNGDAG